MSEVLESVMLLCFGLSWPINTYKAFKARTASSTSLFFILLILSGYLAGICAKVMNHCTGFVLWVYLLNLVIVLLNLAVYFRNKSLDNRRMKKTA